jgi:mRNA interferase HigB
MNRCLILYEPCGDALYSAKGLVLLSKSLKSLQNLPFSAEEQRREAVIHAEKLSIQGVQPTNVNDVKKTFNSADYVGNDRIVFNIKGNQYRLVGLTIFRTRTVFIRFIGTHSAYDKIDVKTI